MALRHDTTEPRGALWGSSHKTGDEAEGDMLLYEGGEWTSHPRIGTRVVMRPTITNPPEPALNLDGSDWVYADVTE